MHLKRLLFALAATTLTAAAARAQVTATWTGTTDSNWFTAGNWSPATVPTGIGASAIFNAGSGAASVSINNPVSLGRLSFTSDALATTLTVGADLAFNGTGIDNASATTQTIVNNGELTFNNSATAGSGVFNLSLGFLDFNNSATAGHATLNNSDSSVLSFNNSSHGSTATIQNDGTLYVRDNANLEQAAVTNGNSDSALLDVASHNTGTTSLGSLAGGGFVSLGASPDVIVRIGGLNTSTTFSGSMSGSGTLVKEGTGTLTLTGDGSFKDGPTTITAGKVILNNPTASSLGNGVVTVQNGATLGGVGIVSGPLFIESGGHLAPGDSTGTFLVNADFTLLGGAILDFQLGTTSSQLAMIAGNLTGVHGGGTVTLNIFNAGGFAAGTYPLFDFSGAWSVTNFDATDFHLGTTISGYDYSLAINNATNTLELTATASAIPEPSTYAALAGAGALGLAVLRRRLRSQPSQA